MEYNTQLKKLVLPEYGRTLQKMVDYCIQIPDRAERTRCANTIINTMGNMFPHLRDVNDFKHLLWDHLAIMSNFQLDIDYPYPVVSREDLQVPPRKVDYPQSRMAYKHYGKILERLILLVADYPEGEEKAQLLWMTLNHMKKNYMQWNKEVDDTKIFEDIYEMSYCKIDLRDSGMRLLDSKEIARANQIMSSHSNTPTTGKKNKKKNKG